MTDVATRTDRQLLDAHVRGEAGAFGELVERHRHRLWVLALRTVGNETDAADALQDALVSAYRRAGSFRGDAAVTTWLHRIVVNACLDRLRWLASRRAEPLTADAERIHAGGPSPQAAAEQADLRDRVRVALAGLSADQRAAIVLVDMFGYSVDEAAELLGCAPGTIKSRCSRGRGTLRAALAEWREGTGPDAAASNPYQHPTSEGGSHA